MKHKIKPGLLPRIIIAIAMGIAIGWISPEWFARLCATFNDIFSQFLGFLIPLIIVGFVTPAIGDIGIRAGKMLIVTLLLAYGATLFAGYTSYFTGIWLFPSMISQDSAMTAVEQGGTTIEPYFTVGMPPLMGVMTALVSSFVIGLGIAVTSAEVLRSAFAELRSVIELTIRKAIVPLLPFYIFGIFLIMTVSGQTGTILISFAKIIAVIFGIHVFILVFQYCIASIFARKNPFKMLWTMMPAYFTALGTSSSAATIPVTLRQSIKMGVSEDVAGFVVPLCATVHMSGSALKLVACSMALMIMQGMTFDIGMFSHFIIMLGITIVAAPGIPGGAIMASLGLLSSILGFSEAQNALMIALYISMDSFGTACNVTGDGALASIVDRFFRPRPRKVPSAS
ncbi:dicarboxylate/amino acid:cation symporter [Paramuribaculum intestinale]|jgi:Na+/H+-dicarboxylate symporter|uniref:dicarboxylate/amino acid:cation symporter n=1 Tax=Paramuribaculum intestinale TaxID=2094151 RepID=UPI000F47CEDB|nr:dicarboxylate/amino acid:cation symporter [Paramuribaculum intestinale]MBJ2186293.1 dicarboxylate/amino acid:cation symporter [Muribaculaceae bacterium]MCX4328965.1 dicarboxylate/amino acid:cation symporter [Paramuribaculum intestinale]ROS94117.1 dicarboxylate/amino acid:cation symporter [Muribaculaceae bacterium Isolate-043 (Harlan)]RXE62071.1 dicarboxylate/amino acid:cation symporter [Muribaculaceae bacterium Isolate-004 (NCI)]